MWQTCSAFIVNNRKPQKQTNVCFFFAIITLYFCIGKTCCETVMQKSGTIDKFEVMLLVYFSDTKENQISSCAVAVNDVKKCGR